MTKKQPANDQGTALRVHWTIEARAYIEYSTCALTRSDRRRAQARWRRQSPGAAIFTVIQSAKIDDIDLHCPGIERARTGPDLMNAAVQF